ncbi:unnamed protein product, partial [Notodromas monacha]
MELLEKDAPEVEQLDDTSLKRLILTYEKKSLKNQEMRMKFPDNPEKFMESEVDLNDAIQSLHIVATAPELYHILVETNAITSLVSLIPHENTDISTAVINLIQELTDVDTLNESKEGADVLIDALLRQQICGVLVSNLERLDENLKEEADGVQNSLATIEHLIDFRGDVVSEDAVSQGLMVWILKRLKGAKGSPVFDGTKLYCAEILSILLQSSNKNRKTLGDLDGIDILLQQLAYYKRHDPSSAEETEMMENLFDCVCSYLMFSPNRDRFLRAEGLQLMNLMLREKKYSRSGALRVLSHALTSGPGDSHEFGSAADSCAKFVEILGLRTIFPLFMKTPKSKRSAPASQHEEHIVSIVTALAKHCRGSQRQRFLAKFAENDSEKLERLAELHFKYMEKVGRTDVRIEGERKGIIARGEEPTPEEDDDFYLQRLSGGLFMLQQIDLLMVEVCAGCPPQVKQRLIDLLSLRGASVKEIRSILRGSERFMKFQLNIHRIIGMRVNQIYDIDWKTYLIRLQRTEEKAVLLLESGNRIHCTNYEWPKQPAPSSFAMKMRKHIKNKRLESLTQLGVDRIVDLQFGSGEASYHLIVELYDRGNMILTDHEYVILNLLRPRTDNEERRIAVGEKYPHENARLDYRMLDATSWEDAVSKAKPNDNLKKLLNPRLDFGPALIEHCLLEAGFPSNAAIGKGYIHPENAQRVLEAMKAALELCRASSFNGYIIQKKETRLKPDASGESEDFFTYAEYHPHKYIQFDSAPFLGFPNFSAAVDEFYSKLENQKLDLKVVQHEKLAMKKLENVLKDRENRLAGLQETQETDKRRGEMIQFNLDLVEKALLVLRSAIANQLSWSEISQMVKDAQDKGDPIAGSIRQLKLEINHFTMALRDPYDIATQEANKPKLPIKDE